MQDTFTKALKLYQAGDFYQAHEELEDCWNDLADEHPYKQALQAFIQILAALHLISLKRYVGAHKVFNRAHKNLQHYPVDKFGSEFKMSNFLNNSSTELPEFKLKEIQKLLKSAIELEQNQLETGLEDLLPSFASLC